MGITARSRRGHRAISSSSRHREAGDTWRHLLGPVAFQSSLVTDGSHLALVGLSGGLVPPRPPSGHLPLQDTRASRCLSPSNSELGLGGPGPPPRPAPNSMSRGLSARLWTERPRPRTRRRQMQFAPVMFSDGFQSCLCRRGPWGTQALCHPFIVSRIARGALRLLCPGDNIPSPRSLRTRPDIAPWRRVLGADHLSPSRVSSG